MKRDVASDPRTGDGRRIAQHHVFAAAGHDHILSLLYQSFAGRFCVHVHKPGALAWQIPLPARTKLLQLASSGREMQHTFMSL